MKFLAFCLFLSLPLMANASRGDTCSEGGDDIQGFTIKSYKVGSTVVLDGKHYRISEVSSDGGGSLDVMLVSVAGGQDTRQLVCGNDVAD